MSEQKRQIETTNQLIFISELTSHELAEVRRLADDEIAERTEQNTARRTSSLGRYLNVNGILGPQDTIRLDQISLKVLRGWLQFIADELEERQPGAGFMIRPESARAWCIILPEWSEASEPGYRRLVGEMTAETLGEIATLCLEEVKLRGIDLGVELTKPGVADNALEATVRHLIRTEPQAALDAFRSLETFCASVRREMEAVLAAEHSPAAPAPASTEPAAPPPAAPEVSAGVIPWTALRLWVAAMPEVGQKQLEILNPADRWRWLHMLRAEGVVALRRCGIFTTDHSMPLSEMLLENVAAIDWTGFPTEPGQL